MSKKKQLITIISIVVIAIAITAGIFLLRSSKTKKDANTVEQTENNSQDQSSLFNTVETKVTEIDMYGDMVLDITDIDLEYGDSINVSASGGWEQTSIPFYPSFYGRKGDTVLSDYFEYLVLGGIATDLNAAAQVKPGETITITLDKKGKYKDELAAYDVDLDMVKWEGQSDEDFRNAREVTKGNIRPGVLYRGSSPTDEAFNRIELMDEFIQENDIKCVLALSDDDELIASRKDNLPQHTQEMIENGQFIALGIGVDFEDKETEKRLGDGLVKMTEMEGPYLVQCSYGKDRTGVVIALLEFLCGATYEEVLDDYMLSYKCLHNIDMNPESLQYKLSKQRLDEELAYAMGISSEEVPDADLEAGTRRYLKECGMTDEQIDKLKDLFI